MNFRHQHFCNQISRQIFLGGAPLLSIAVGFLVGERLIVGRFLQHGLSAYYWIYEFVFFMLLVVAYGVLRTRLAGWPKRVFVGLALAYLASFLSYHCYILLSHSPAGWFGILEENPILIVFAPACLVGLIVGGIYVITLELLNEVPIFAGRYCKR